MDSESRGASTGKHARSDDEKPSDEDDSRSPAHRHKRKEKVVQESNDSEDINDSDDEENCSRPQKKHVRENQLEEVDEDEAPPTDQQSPSATIRRTQNKYHTQYRGGGTMPAKTKKKNKRHQGNNNTYKHDRQLPKKNKKKRSPSYESSAESDTDVNAKKVVYEDSTATFAADFTLLECFMRQAIHYFSPATKYKKPVMYWSPKVKTAAAHMLIERHYDDIPNLIDRYGGQIALEIRFADDLRFLANNERAVQTRQIKSTYLSKQNPECRLAENFIEQELDLDQTQPPRIHKNNIGHIKSVGALRELLMSPKMYQNQVLINIFCLRLESGNFRQNRHHSYTPLNELITKAHEAHFRVELYLALSKKSFRHHNTCSDISERVRLFNLAIISIREGREKYMQKAVETRMQNRTQRQIKDSERDNEQEVGSDDNVDIDEETDDL